LHKTIILAVKRICAVKAIITIFFLAISTISFGQLGGERSYTFLEIPSSARSAAMGGSSSGIKDADINLINDNPANLDTSIDNHFLLAPQLAPHINRHQIPDLCSFSLDRHLGD
jgi:hypothetical protein